MSFARMASLSVLVVAFGLVPGSAQQSGESYKLDLHVLSEIGEKGEIEMQIEGVAGGSPTFPDNAIFKVEIRRKIYKALWPNAEIREAEDATPVDSFFIQVKKGRFLKVNPPVAGEGRYTISAEFDPRHQQYKNVAADMGAAYKQYRFSTEHLIGEMLETTGEKLGRDAKALTDAIDEIQKFLETIEKAAFDGKELVDKQDEFMGHITGAQSQMKQLCEMSTFTTVPRLLAAIMTDFQPYYVEALARVKGGLPPFEFIQEQKGEPKRGEDPKEEKIPGEDVRPAVGGQAKTLMTSYGGRLTIRDLKEDLDIMRELLIREEFLLTLDLLARAEQDFLKAFLNNDKDLDVAIEHFKSGLEGIERRHAEALKNEEEKNMRLDALRGKDREYRACLESYKKLLKVKPGPKGEEETKKLVAELAKMSEELRAEISKPRKEDEHEDEKEEPKKK